jgi:hypothetical protein
VDELCQHDATVCCSSFNVPVTDVVSLMLVCHSRWFIITATEQKASA